MNIVTLNAQWLMLSKHTAAEYNKKVIQLGQYLMTKNPDVICLQEVDAASIEDLKVCMESEYTSYMGTACKHLGQNTATLVKLGLHVEAVKRIKCLKTVVLRINGIHIYNLHMSAGPTKGDRRNIHAKQIRDHLKTHSDPVIIAGDFNDFDNTLKTVYRSSSEVFQTLRSEKPLINVHSYLELQVRSYYTVKTPGVLSAVQTNCDQMYYGTNFIVDHILMSPALYETHRNPYIDIGSPSDHACVGVTIANSQSTAAASSVVVSGLQLPVEPCVDIEPIVDPQ